MDENIDRKPPDIARSLLRRSRQGALATLTPGSGDPYCSLVNVASAHDGSPILLISKLAIHTRNILADARVSLMLDERAPGDPLEGARIMVGGVAEQAGGDKDVLRRRYLAVHPSAEMFAGFGDFAFFRIVVKGVHLVAGFGRIVDLKPQDVLTNLGGADELIASEPDILAHMNAEHADTMNLYATKLLGAEDGEWRATGCDAAGLDMQDGSRVLRLDFPQRIVSGAALRQTLKALANEARQKPN
ncbi:MAG: pyridoxamine 5'-phosphate oxidase family protein [Afipia sp.]|nr:pyridoxamine 5'-phosphate oxidase family protein [Afipia sp.]